MLKKLENLEIWIIAISMLLMTVITFSNVISRYVLHQSWSFTEEITTNLFVWVTFLGASVATKRKGHLGLSILTDYLPPVLKKAAIAFTVLCSVVLFSILFKYGVDMVKSQSITGQTSPALGWPEWIFGISVPVGALILIFRFLELGYQELKGGE